MTACIIVPECKIKVLKHWKLYKDTYILQESFAMTDKSYPPLIAIIYSRFTYPWRFMRVPSVYIWYLADRYKIGSPGIPRSTFNFDAHVMRLLKC